MLEFTIDELAKKKIAHRQFIGSISGKVILVLVVICIIFAVASLLILPSIMTDSFVYNELGANNDSIDSVRSTTCFFICVMPILIAFFLIICGYRQITANTAMRTRERVYIDDAGRLVCSFKLSNDFRYGMNVVSIGLSSCNISVKNGIITFSGDVLGAYITDWYDGAVVPLDKLGPMTKPFELGLYLRPDLLKSIQNLMKY